MKQAAKVQTQLTFKNHSGNTTTFQQQVLVQKEARALNDSRKYLRSGKNEELNTLDREHSVTSGYAQKITLFLPLYHCCTWRQCLA